MSTIGISFPGCEKNDLTFDGQAIFVYWSWFKERLRQTLNHHELFE